MKIDWFDGKLNFINNIPEQTCIQISQAAGNVQEVLEMYALGACVRDALDELTEWHVNANESGNYLMRNLHAAERFCRGFLFEFRTCLDHMETEIKRKHGKDSELCKVFKDSVSKEYDVLLYKVFTDSNIYDGSNYSFHNALFTVLRNKAASDEMELHINSVVEGEVKEHIKRDVKKAVKELSNVIVHPKLAGFRKLSTYQDKLNIPDPKEWVQKALDEFDSFLLDCHVKRKRTVLRCTP